MRRPGFLARLREARLFRVLLLYVGASWIILQATAILRNEFQLPEWVTPFVLILLAAGLVIISATAWVQAHPPAKAREGEVPAPWELNVRDLAESIAARRIPHLTWARAILGGVFAFSLLFGVAGLYVLLKQRGAAISPVREATAAPGPGIAVLPFRVVGPGLELWREGMIDLLSTNLDGVAGLRKIDPRAVLSRWRSEIGEGKDAPDPDAALQVARKLGASYALIGSAVALGAGVRLTAEVYDLSTGKLQGTALMEGQQDSVFALVNRLSINVLQTALKGERGLPEVDLTRVTTTSLPALKAYLAGEQNYRRNRFTEAIADFTRAVEADSTFALALYRLRQAYGWVEGDSPRTSEYFDRTTRLADRLPEREALVQWALASGRSVAGIQQLEEITVRYPDYVEGWYQLGDYYFHVGDHGLYPYDKFRHAFRTALELDPTLGPALIHLIDDAFANGDSAGAREWAARLREIDPSSPRALGPSLAYDLAWGDSASKRRARAALDTAGADLVGGAHSPFRYSPDFWEPLIETSRALARPRQSLSYRRFGQTGIIRAHVWRGRLREARAAVSPFPGEEPFGVHASRIYLVLHLAGYSDTTTARRAARSMASSSELWDRFLLGAFEAHERRWGAVGERIAALESPAREAASREDSLEALFARAYAQALRGYTALRRGDSQNALRDLEEAFPVLPAFGPLGIATYIHGLLRYEAARALLELGNAAEAERYLRSLEFQSPATRTPMEYYLGEAYEALGNIAEAKVHYGRFVRWWEDCDPELRPMWERGRQALERLAREASPAASR